MTGERSASRERLLQRALVPSLFVLVGTGLLLSLDAFVELPAFMLGTLLATLALGVPLFFAAAVATSRAEGIGFFRSVGRAVHATFRVICDLF